MRRIFYFSGYRMKIFEWQGRRLLGSYEFEPDDAGFAEFTEYLSQAPRVAAQLLVDVIEEDFHRETIPHVSGRDRKALVARLLDRHYRDDLHNHVLFIGRGKEGRRDDQVLLSALTNLEVLDPWLTRLDQHQVPLAGIWSLPLLIEGVVKHVAGDEPNVMIVSRQIRSAQRETFFNNGKLLFSRQAKLDRNMRDDDSAEAIVQNLVTGTEQIRHFLTNQRIIGFTEPLTAVRLLPDDKIDAATAACSDTGLVKYRFAGLGSLFSHFKLKNCDGMAADVLFAFFCSQKPLFDDHYGQPNEKYQFYRFAVDRTIDVVATLGALLVVTAAALMWLSTTDLRQQRMVTDAGRALLERRYEAEFNTLGQQLTDAPLIQASVEHVRKIKLESEQTPQRFFAPLSGVYSQPRFRYLSLSELIWTKYRAQDVARIVSETVSLKEPDDGYGGYPEAMAEGQERLTLQQPVLKLVGELDRENLSYRETVATMRDFVASLEALPEVEQIHILRTPVDIRPEVRFSDQGGLEQSGRVATENTNRYELLIVLARAGAL